ncbi:MAG TPA: histidine phosphatase family protein [Gaiellaceae bacterium]|nr:histidine phosphatase family protein [Gaiellaceae bacterium]
MSIQIVFETHSTSTDNEAGVATGWSDGRLSELGKRQAAELGARRRDDGVAAVFTSDLGRAVETARIAFGGSGIPVHRDPRLRECDYGELTGAPVSAIEEQRMRRIDEPFRGGESYRQAVERVRTFLADLPAELDGQRIVVIGHAATRWALQHLLGRRELADLLSEPFAWQEGWEFSLDVPGAVAAPAPRPPRG